MKWQYLVYAVVMACSGMTLSYAQGTPAVSLVLTPVQTVYVKGDVNKFRAINWTKDGSQSGIKSLTVDSKVGQDVNVSFEGSGMYGDADYAGQMILTKDEVGYIKLNYDTFRKYYDNSGGYFPSFTQSALDGQKLQLITLDKELALDIGHFAFEIGRGTPEDSSLSFGYERDTKDGSKSSLSWGYVKDTVFGTGTDDQRLFAPSYNTVDNVTDTITLKGKTKAAGFNVKGEQKVVLFNGHTIQQAQMKSNSGTAADNQFVLRNLNPESKELMTTLRGERWSLNDKTYFALGYRFAHSNNDNFQTQAQYNSLTGAVLNTQNREMLVRGRQDSNIWTAELLSNVTDNFVAISRFKTELQDTWTGSDRDSSATTVVVPVTDRNTATAINTAEGVSLRYSGISKTSLYADFDLKQERYNRTLTMQSESSVLESLNHLSEGSGALGARISPLKNVNVTAEYKRLSKNDKLERFRATSSLDNDGAFGIFRTDKDQLMSRVSWKPVKWLENSAKISQATTVYHTKSLDYDMSKTPGAERNFVYNVAVTPNDKWMFDLSYSLKMLKVGGRGSQYSYTPSPSTSNAYSYMFSTSYAPTDKLSIFNSLEYGRAKNLTNADGTSLTNTSATETLWGVNDEWWNIDTGAKWDVKKDISIEPHYAYYSYRSFPGIETGNYSAHVLWLDVSTKW